MEKSVISNFFYSACFVFSVCVPTAFALGANFELPVKGGEKLLVNVSQAMLQMTANPSLKAVKVQMSAQAATEYGLYAESGVIEVRRRDGINKESFASTVKPEPAKYTIEIQSPSLPLEVHIFDGQVQLSKWSKESLVHLQKGKMFFRDGNGTLAVHGQNGEISISNHQGRLDLDAYKAQLKITDLAGDADIENFSGESTIDSFRGVISLRQDQGTAKVNGSSGTLKFEIGKATLSTQNFAGRVEGQTQEGPINVVMAADSEVNVKSQSGRVTVNSGKAPGSALNLVTVDGDISGPNYLKVNRESGQKTLRGRLNGDVQKGSIVVRSQEGAIIIR